MAKKKNKQNNTQILPPERYVREKGRLLPITACYVNEEWQNYGMATVIVVRSHRGGTYTVGLYIVDTFCLGVKDSNYRFSLSDIELAYFFKTLEASIGPLKHIEYNEAHNLIYGAIAFAEEAGIQPHSSFKLTQYLLEEDTDDIPLIEYEYGKDGKYFLITSSRQEANRCLPILRKHLGDDFDFLIDDDDYEKETNEEDWMKNMRIMQERMKKENEQPMVEYAYEHPAYPTELQVENEWIVPLLFNPNYFYGLPDELTDKILALHHDSLRHDLEQIILWETGRTCDHISDERDEDSPLLHSLFFLSELGHADSLDVVLETLRQNEDYYDFHCGDAGYELYPATLYRLGLERLDTLFAYMEEPGLVTWERVWVAEAVSLMTRLHPERRDEFIGWFRRLLTLYSERIAECKCCDSQLAGMVISCLLDMKAVELQAEIKRLFDTGLVNEMVCGDYDEVMTELLSPEPPRYTTTYPIGIHERYKAFRKKWGGK